MSFFLPKQVSYSSPPWTQKWPILKSTADNAKPPLSFIKDIRPREVKKPFLGGWMPWVVKVGVWNWSQHLPAMMDEKYQVHLCICVCVLQCVYFAHVYVCVCIVICRSFKARSLDLTYHSHTIIPSLTFTLTGTFFLTIITFYYITLFYLLYSTSHYPNLPYSFPCLQADSFQ